MTARIRWRRAFAAAAIASVLVLAALAAPRAWHAWQSPPPLPADRPAAPATEAQQAEIVAAILRGREPPESTDRPPAVAKIVVPDRTLAVCRQTLSGPIPGPSGCLDPAARPVYPGHADSDIPGALREQLFVGGAESVAMRDPGVPGTRPGSASALYALLFSNARDRQEAFHREFPGADVIHSFSRAAVTVDGRYALIYVETDCLSWCRSGMLYLLESTPDGWRHIGGEPGVTS